MSGHHIVPIRTYAVVFTTLLVLLVLTVAIAYVHLGALALPIAMAIAIVKALLIIMFFMEVKYQSKLVWVFAGSSFVFLIIMFVMTMNDYATRVWWQSHLGY